MFILDIINDKLLENYSHWNIFFFFLLLADYKTFMMNKLEHRRLFLCVLNEISLISFSL